MVDVIIVSWNVAEIIRDCIDSLIGEQIVRRIIVVDNGSHDGTGDILKAISYENEKVISVINSNNIGFAAACNQGATYALSNEILFMNPDVVVQNNAISDALITKLIKKVDVLGIRLIDETGNTQRTCADFPTLASFIFESTGLSKVSAKHFPGYRLLKWPHDEDCYVEHVIGAFYLMSRSRYFELGGMDESFFVYYEDLDLSKRVIDSGGKIFYAANIISFHEGGGSSKSVKGERLFHSFYSQLLYANKHLGRFKATIHAVNLLTISRLTRSTLHVLHRDRRSLKETNYAYSMLLNKLWRSKDNL